MAKFLPTVWERLLDIEEVPEASYFYGVSLDSLRQSVAKDIEAILNSRSSIDVDVLSSFPRALASIVNFGVRDFSGMSLASSLDQTRICSFIESAISRHEPRLANVVVSLKGVRGSDRGFMFAVNAVLMLDPKAEPVIFDAVLQPGNRRYTVSMGTRPSLL